MKNINKYMMASLALCAGFAYTACDEDELDPNPIAAGSGVSLTSFGPTPLERLDTIQIFGKGLNKVSKVIFPNAEVNQFVSRSGNCLEVVIPDEARPGKIGLLNGKDTVWSKTLITFQEPISIASISATKGIMPGSQITFKGEYLYNIASVTFEVGQTINAENFVKSDRRELTVTVPKGAVSGDVVLTDGANWVYKQNVEILAAQVTALTPDSTDFGQQVTITGENLNLVEKITFAGNVAADKFELSADNKTITLNVPEDATPGAITLTQYSLVNVNTPELKLPVVSVLDVNPKTDIKVGDMITITGHVFDHVKSIMVGGDVVVSEFTLKKGEIDEITFPAPEGMKNGKITLTQNANLSAQTDGVKIYKEPAPEELLEEGPIVATGWSNQPTVLKGGELEGAAGKILRLYVTVEEGWALQLFDAWWGGQLCNQLDKDSYDLAANDNIIEITVTEEMAAKVTETGGIVLNGDKVTVNKITLMSAESVIADGPIIATGWSNQPTILTTGELEGAAGKTLCMYVTVEEGWALQIFDAWWGGQLCNQFDKDSYDLEANENIIAILLTEAFVAKVNETGGIVLNGDKVTVNKVTLK